MTKSIPDGMQSIFCMWFLGFNVKHILGSTTSDDIKAFKQPNVDADAVNTR